MNARIARKIHKHREWYLYPERIWGQGRLDRACKIVERHDRKHRIFLSSLALVRLLEAGKTEEAKAHWAQLRERIIQHWCGPLSSEAVAWGEGVARERGNLPDNIEYYSDRWCQWRVAAIDYGMRRIG